MIESIVGLLLIAIVLGVVFYLVDTFIFSRVPALAPLRVVLIVLGVLVVCLALLDLTGLTSFGIVSPSLSLRD